MKKIILVGRSGSGKTTLSQALSGKKLSYDKTQYVKRIDGFIDTPGEYAETKMFGGALAIYSYESDVIGLVQNACEPFTLFPPAIVAMANRPVIGIITQIDCEGARVDLAQLWLENAGCRKIFKISSKTGKGLEDLLDYLQD